MTTDAWLAIFHHLAVFGLLTVLAAEWGLLRPGLGATEVRRLGRIDAAYGGFAVAVLVAGIARLVAGDKPFSFYSDNPFFWIKLGAFATVGILSIGPTIRFIRWRQALTADGSATPEAADVQAARKRLIAELAVFPVIPVCAALMARGIGS